MSAKQSHSVFYPFSWFLIRFIPGAVYFSTSAYHLWQVGQTKDPHTYMGEAESPHPWNGNLIIKEFHPFSEFKWMTLSCTIILLVLQFLGQLMYFNVFSAWILAISFSLLTGCLTDHGLFNMLERYFPVILAPYVYRFGLSLLQKLIDSAPEHQKKVKECLSHYVIHICILMSVLAIFEIGWNFRLGVLTTSPYFYLMGSAAVVKLLFAVELEYLFLIWPFYAAIAGIYGYAFAMYPVGSALMGNYIMITWLYLINPCILLVWYSSYDVDVVYHFSEEERSGSDIEATSQIQEPPLQDLRPISIPPPAYNILYANQPQGLIFSINKGTASDYIVIYSRTSRYVYILITSTIKVTCLSKRYAKGRRKGFIFLFS